MRTTIAYRIMRIHAGVGPATGVTLYARDLWPLASTSASAITSAAACAGHDVDAFLAKGPT